MAFLRRHNIKGALPVTHSRQQIIQRDDECQHSRVCHISSLGTLIRTLHISPEAMLGGEAVWID